MQGETSSAQDHYDATQPLFSVGFLTATTGASELFLNAGEDPMIYLARHLRGDWSEMPPEDAQSNRAAVQNGSRIFSSYKTAQQKPLWVITEADRSVTTFLLPSEY